MWLTTTAGFFSAVQDRTDPDRLVVRTRDRESAQALVDGVETLCGEAVSITEREGTDYPYRVYVSRENYALWVSFEVRQYVTYHNFKDAVKETRGAKWASALAKVWGAMLEVTDPWMRDHGYYGGSSSKADRTFGNPHYGDYSQDYGVPDYTPERT